MESSGTTWGGGRKGAMIKTPESKNGDQKKRKNYKSKQEMP